MISKMLAIRKPLENVTPTIAGSSNHSCNQYLEIINFRTAMNDRNGVI